MNIETINGWAQLVLFVISVMALWFRQAGRLDRMKDKLDALEKRLDETGKQVGTHNRLLAQIQTNTALIAQSVRAMAKCPHAQDGHHATSDLVDSNE